MANNIDTHDNTKESTVRELLNKLVEEKNQREKKADTKSSKKQWKWPRPWSAKMSKSQKKQAQDQVLVFYLNIKGEIEAPILQPLYSGNMVIIRNKVYEVDPRAFWTVKIGFKLYKVLLIKEIDRRPVSNLDYSEIRKRGDATDSDEFLIKAALRAQLSQTAKSISKWVIIAIVIAVIAAIIYFLFASGNKGAATTTTTTAAKSIIGIGLAGGVKKKWKTS
jgi:hypothetical protein